MEIYTIDCQESHIANLPVSGFRIHICFWQKLQRKWYMVCFHCLLKDFHAVKISILMLVELQVFVSLFSSWMIRLKGLVVLT